MKKKVKILFVILFSIIFLGLLLILFSGGILTFLIVNERADFKEIENPEKYNIRSKEIMLTTSDDFEIQAFEVSVENPKGYIILLSGIQSPSVTAFYGYSKAFKNIGYSSLLIEMRAHGESDGDKIMLGYTEEQDVYAGINYIDEKNPNIPIIVMGTSMGGSVAINSTANIPRINGVISQSAFSSWEENIMDQFIVNGIPSFIAKIQVPFTRFLLGFKYGFNKINNSPTKNIEKIDSTKILLIHSTDDSQVIYNNYVRLSEKINGPFDHYVVNGDRHFILETDEEFDNPLLNSDYFEVLKLFLSHIIDRNN